MLHFPPNLFQPNCVCTYNACTCNIFVRHQTDLEIFEIAIFLLIYQLQFLFLCDKVFRRRKLSQWLNQLILTIIVAATPNTTLHV